MAPLIPIAMRIILGLAGITLATLGVNKFTKSSEKNYFNNGICKKCGGHFKYIDGTEINGNKGYKCDNCDNCVWISFGSDINYTYKPSNKE